MSENYHLIEERIEDGVAAFLDQHAKKPASDIATKIGFEFSEKGTPYKFARVPTCTPDEYNSGAYDVTLQIGVVTNEDVARAVHAEYVGAVMDVIFHTDFLTNLRAVIRGVSIGRHTMGPRQRTVRNSLRITMQEITLHEVAAEAL